MVVSGAPVAEAPMVEEEATAEAAIELLPFHFSLSLFSYFLFYLDFSKK